MGVIIQRSAFKSALNEVKDLVPRSKDPSKLRTGELPALNDLVLRYFRLRLVQIRSPAEFGFVDCQKLKS
jgi:hypothetical protein